MKVHKKTVMGIAALIGAAAIVGGVRHLQKAEADTTTQRLQQQEAMERHLAKRADVMAFLAQRRKQ